MQAHFAPLCTVALRLGDIRGDQTADIFRHDDGGWKGGRLKIGQGILAAVCPSVAATGGLNRA